jgi:hypothetical protein
MGFVFMLFIYICIYSAQLQYNNRNINAPDLTELLKSWEPRNEKLGTAINVFIFSHRRSGTHLTINMLRYGFSGVRVWKMNHASCGNCTLVDTLIRNGKVIHASRDPKQVAASMHNYTNVLRSMEGKSNINFSEYMISSQLGESWQRYVGTCQSNAHILQLDFDTTINMLGATLQRVSAFLGVPIAHRLSKIPSTQAVRFNGGDTGGWRQVFTNDTLRMLYDQVYRASPRDMEQCPCENGSSDITHRFVSDCVARPTLYL